MVSLTIVPALTFFLIFMLDLLMFVVDVERHHTLDPEADEHPVTYTGEKEM